MAKPPSVTPSSNWRMVSMNESKPTARWITEQILAMQSFFYLPDLPPKVDAIAMGHWFAALSDLPEPAIEQAIRARMLRPGRQRPTPGEIRENALGRISRPEKPLKLAPPPVVVTAEEMEERRAVHRRLHDAYPDIWKKWNMKC